MKLVKYIVLLGLVSCSSTTKKDTLLFSFPKRVKEVSGIKTTANSNLIWTIQDSGNPNEIYGIDQKGSVSKTISVSNAENIDWEDITSDNEGNLYIGDFGNNNNERKDLAIYKISSKNLEQSEVESEYKIMFSYPEQTDFPPKKKELFYDCEGFFEMNNHFYLFTKNRSKGFDGTTFVYKIPNTPGNHQAVLLGKFKTCSEYNTCVITSAAISQDLKKVVILSHDAIWLFENFTDDNFLNGKATALQLDNFSQKEAICFKDNNTLYIADEKTKKIGGNLYEYTISSLKPKP
ncbi:hypothetical protein [Flavobacterium aquatile]|uniref:SdiA-regulated family protein n=1 Tax=Flavobacterium aquatile LMG 4008 = ATCC 11947 TaxID=1453498 RepID=A0A095SXS5_9FLAO|nr:hypothetical protein [Flavobacterium aquatile]KGD69377.1 hypothetical protein LG45_00980 [Flavobacterium aquatile LMG 4008 = ATCC 11947]OXA66166.1 hypothetical protein B0A61_12910 [Flavobacterium aquatile LMG 4008 = ATCC 11947]GEC77656.1 hypothetical protein FAQ01_05260 [Flavobacterium aquatile]